MGGTGFLERRLVVLVRAAPYDDKDRPRLASHREAWGANSWARPSCVVSSADSPLSSTARQSGEWGEPRPRRDVGAGLSVQCGGVTAPEVYPRVYKAFVKRAFRSPA